MQCVCVCVYVLEFLYFSQAGENRWGTDESMFNKILVTRSYVQLQRTFDIYVKVTLPSHAINSYHKHTRLLNEMCTLPSSMKCLVIFVMACRLLVRYGLCLYTLYWLLKWCVNTVKCVHSRPMYFAEKLYKSMKGAGTDDTTLIRIIVSRSEVEVMFYSVTDLS